MTPAAYRDLREKVILAGYGYDIDWAETVSTPKNAVDFAREAIWVICCSGMAAKVARRIEAKVLNALDDGRSAHTQFGHEGKADAIDSIWNEREALYAAYLEADDKIAFLETLPWIGPITKMHLAKNCGLDVVKPDRHLVRIADHYGKTPEQLCQDIAEHTGERIGTVDIVLWRAAELGFLNMREMAA